MEVLVLILGPVLQPSCLVCRILLRVLQERQDLKAAVLADVHVLFGDGTKSAA